MNWAKIFFSPGLAKHGFCIVQGNMKILVYLKWPILPPPELEKLIIDWDYAISKEMVRQLMDNQRYWGFFAAEFNPHCDLPWNLQAPERLPSKTANELDRVFGSGYSMDGNLWLKWLRVI